MTNLAFPTYPSLYPYGLSRSSLFDVLADLTDRAVSINHPSYVTRDNDDGSHTISIDVPGVRREDLKLVEKQNNIYVAGRRDGKDLEPIVITVPVSLDPSSATAVLEDGVLSVTFQPIPERTIEIR